MRFFRWLAVVMLGVCALIAALPTLLSTSYGQQFCRTLAARVYPGTIQFESLSIGWLSGVEVRKLHITDPNGRELLSCAHFSLERSLAALMFSRKNLGSITAQSPVVYCYTSNRPQAAQEQPREKSHHRASHTSSTPSTPDHDRPSAPQPLQISPDLRARIDVSDGQLITVVDDTVLGGLSNGNMVLDIDLKNSSSGTFHGTLVQGSSNIAPVSLAFSLESLSVPSDLRGSLNISCQNVPTQVLAALGKSVSPNAQDFLVETFGKTLSLTVQASAENKAMSIQSTLSSDNLRSSLQASVHDGILTITPGDWLTGTISPKLFSLITNQASLKSPSSFALKNMSPCIVDMQSKKLVSPCHIQLATKNPLSLVIGTQTTPLDLSITSAVQGTPESAHLSTTISAAVLGDVGTVQLGADIVPGSGLFSSPKFALDIQAPTALVRRFCPALSSPSETIKLHIDSSGTVTSGQKTTVTVDHISGQWQQTSFQAKDITMSLDADGAKTVATGSPTLITLPSKNAPLTISIAPFSVQQTAKTLALPSLSAVLQRDDRPILSLTTSATLSNRLEAKLDVQGTVTPRDAEAITAALGSTASVHLTDDVTVALSVPTCTADLSPLSQSKGPSPLHEVLEGASVHATCSLSKIALSLGQIAPLSAQFDLRGSAHSLSCSVDSKDSSDPAVAIHMHNTMTDLWDGQGWTLPSSRIHSTLEVNTLPTKLLELFCPGQGALLEEAIGKTIQVAGKVTVDALTSGTAQLDIRAQNCSMHLDGTISKGIMTLKNPAEAQLTVTKEAGSLMLKNINPLLATAVRSERPIRLTVDPTGFAVPLAPLSLSTVRIPKVTIDAGKITAKNGGAMQVILALLNLGTVANQEHIDIWLTPIYMSMEHGFVTCQRADALIANSLHMITWGNADLVRDNINMVIAIPEESLSRLHLPTGGGRGIQIPITGSAANPKVDTKRATAKLAGAGMMGAVKDSRIQALGGLIQVAASIGEQDQPIPPPTTSPLPWEGK